MAKPENPGNGNGNDGNEGNGEDDASSVVLVKTIDEETERFEGTSRIAVEGGSLLVGKGPTAIFGPDQWVKAWTEALVPAAP